MTMLSEGTIGSERTEMFLALAGSSDPIDLLVGEYDDALRYLTILDDGMNTIRLEGFSDEIFQRIIDALRFLSPHVLQHNRKEEKYLFPLLGRHGNHALYRMKQEHRELIQVFVKLLRCVRRIKTGEITQYAIEEFVHNGIEIIDLLGEHFAQEGKMLFPLAKKLLSLEEYEQFKNGILVSAVYRG
ncbi:MAG: hemerythrin domain-containing protein [Bacteroidota bacterium]